VGILLDCVLEKIGSGEDLDGVCGYATIGSAAGELSNTRDDCDEGYEGYCERFTPFAFSCHLHLVSDFDSCSCYPFLLFVAISLCLIPTLGPCPCLALSYV